MQAIECWLDALLAQHALPPAKALDAASIAAATNAVVVTLVMVNAQTSVMRELFNCMRG